MTGYPGKTYITRQREVTDPQTGEGVWLPIELCVEYKLYPGSPGRTWGLPENCYPPEPDEVDVTSAVRTDTDEAVELTEDEYDRVRELAGEGLAEPDFDEPDHDDFDYDTNAEVEWESPY